MNTRVMPALLAAAALTALAWTAQTATATARPAASCGQLVQQTRQDLANAGAATGDTDWQSVRDDAQRFVNDHPWGGAGTRKLQEDIQELNASCAP
jgi:ElaB/YqjD/DUF883 family membrane-anchored ribosome-binding protein